MMWEYGGHPAHFGGWGWALMGFGTVVFWAVLVIALVLVVRHLAAQRPTAARVPTAAESLAVCYARGEISEDEYRARLESLERRR